MKNSLLTCLLVITTAVLGAQDLFVNEVLSVNKGITKDKFGNADDCIEIYNASNKSIDISGFFLSDDKDSLDKWEFPKGTIILPEGFILVWADNELKEPGLHANFKLSSKGETVRLSDPGKNEIHKLKCKRQFGDVSFGLYPDGSEEKRYMIPSFGRRNKNDRIMGYSKKTKKDKIKIRINSDYTGIVVYNNTGESVRAVVKNKEDQVFHRSWIKETSGMIYLEELEAGRYELQVGRNIYRIVIN